MVFLSGVTATAQTTLPSGQDRRPSAPEPSMEAPQPAPGAPGARDGDAAVKASAPPAAVSAPAPVDDHEGHPSLHIWRRFSVWFAGYFRAPLRLAIAKRSGDPAPGDKGSYDYRQPLLVDSYYYKSNFAYTPVNESDWTELYLSVGHPNYFGTIGLMATSLTDSAFSPDTSSFAGQNGVSQAYVTLKFAPVIARQEIRLQVKAGGFWERFGYQKKYDTYLFARTHLTGEQIRLETTFKAFTFSFCQGLGLHLPDSGTEGLAVAHYYRLSAQYRTNLELGVNILRAFSSDKVRNTGTDSTMAITGFDVTADFRLFGTLNLGFSWVSLDAPQSLTAAFEVMHTFKGPSLQSAYLGPTAQTGGLFNVGFQYDYHINRLIRRFLSKHWLFAEERDLVISFFGLYMKTHSDAEAPTETDIWKGYNGRRYFKYGIETSWRFLRWLGVALRYDSVSMDLSNVGAKFVILSPRVIVYPGLLRDAMVFLQYSRYGYGSSIVRQPQDVSKYGEVIDTNVFKIQAQFTF